MKTTLNLKYKHKEHTEGADFILSARSKVAPAALRVTADRLQHSLSVRTLERLMRDTGDATKKIHIRAVPAEGVPQSLVAETVATRWNVQAHEGRQPSPQVRAHPRQLHASFDDATSDGHLSFSLG